MTGKTHLAFGTASALFITQPGSVKELILCLGAASVGSLISDIDVSTSKSRNDLNKITGVTIFIIALICFMEYKWNIGIRNSFDQNSNMVRLITGFLVFLGVCTYGKLQPHRSFMHSILAVIILSGVLYMIFPIIVPYFAVAMISHIVIDMLNYIDVRILYPLKGGISLNICHADGLINSLIFKASIVVVAVKTVMILYNL